MGSPNSEKGDGSNEGPQHEVTIGKPIAVGKFDGRPLPSGMLAGLAALAPRLAIAAGAGVTGPSST